MVVNRTSYNRQRVEMVTVFAASQECIFIVIISYLYVGRAQLVSVRIRQKPCHFTHLPYRCRKLDFLTFIIGGAE